MGSTNPAPGPVSVPISLNSQRSGKRHHHLVMNAVSLALTLATKVWDAMPADAKATAAGDYEKLLHNLSAPLIDVTGKINAALGVK